MDSSLHSLTGGVSAATIPSPGRRWTTRVGIPLGVVVGTILVLVAANRDRFAPRIPVQTVRVAVATASPDTASSQSDQPATTATVSVQAPGWVEPAPHPVFVTALADGIVEELLVLEGEHVHAGQPVALLVQDDARLEVAGAEAVLARRRALLAAAETDWEHPVELQRALDVATAGLAEAQAHHAALEADLAMQTAHLEEAEAVYQSLKPLSGEAAPEVEVNTARLKRDARQAAVEATRARRNVAQAQIARFEAECAAARQNLDLRVDLKRRLDEGRAAVREAETDLEEARLRLERMTVVSPASGIVMDRLVAPGAKVMRAMDGAASAHIVHLYDPDSLQVRVDVPLVDAAKIRVGQSAAIVVDVLPDTEFAGTVTRFVHQADISKNTVQVKVAIQTTSRHVKPDMLARVKFLAQPPDDTTDAETAANNTDIRIFAPEKALVNDGTAAWVLDPAGERVHRRNVRSGRRRRKGWLEIVEGLHAGDVLVAAPTPNLREGRRIHIMDEEDSP